VHTRLCFGSVLKRSLSARWKQVKLFLSLLIWIADCTQFLSENRLNRSSNFWMIPIFENWMWTDFRFSAHPWRFVGCFACCISIFASEFVDRWSTGSRGSVDPTFSSGDKECHFLHAINRSFTVHFVNFASSLVHSGAQYTHQNLLVAGALS